MFATFKHDKMKYKTVILKVLFEHTSPIEPMLKNSVICNNKVTVLKAGAALTSIATANRSKVTSVMAVDGVTSL